MANCTDCGANLIRTRSPMGDVYMCEKRCFEKTDGLTIEERLKALFAQDVTFSCKIAKNQFDDPMLAATLAYDRAFLVGKFDTFQEAVNWLYDSAKRVGCLK